ncbi:MAG: lysine biosynthesis protein LysW [bacterium]|nr:lysine biosynthesis protein LysW [bacterium]
MYSNAACPICDGSLNPDANTIVGELLECMDCGGELVVNSLAPLAIEEAPAAEEDWGE